MAYFFVCIFKIFVKQQFDFNGCLLHLSRPQEETQTKVIVGQFIHELYQIMWTAGVDNFYDLNRALINIIKSEDEQVNRSCLPNLARTMCFVNHYLKCHVIGELWDMEKFSLKEATNEPDVEKYAQQVHQITAGFVQIGRQLTTCQSKDAADEGMVLSKNWREIKLFIEQLINMIDTHVFFEDPLVSDEAWGKNGAINEEDSEKKIEPCSGQNPQQLMQFFQLNNLCSQLFDTAFELLMKGLKTTREPSLMLLCNFICNIASSVRRMEYIQRVREALFFEYTNVSWR